MTNFVDGVAMALPWAGGLVPATLTYKNLVDAGLEPWQALVVAAVVEGMGFVAVTTVIDLYEEDGGAAVWIALGGACVYLAAVLVINTALDQEASGAQIITGGLLSTFGVLGGVMVALRNQLGKRRAAVAVSEAQGRVEQERLDALRVESERQLVEHERAMQAEELRLRHELAVRKLEAESAVKMEKVRAVQTQSAPSVPAVAAQSEAVRMMVRCTEPGCGMEYAAIGGKGGHYKKWHPRAAHEGVLQGGNDAS